MCSENKRLAESSRPRLFKGLPSQSLQGLRFEAKMGFSSWCFIFSRCHHG